MEPQAKAWRSGPRCRGAPTRLRWARFPWFPLKESQAAFALDEGGRTSHNVGLVATPPKHDAKTIHQAIDRVASAIAARHGATERLLLLGIANGGIVFARRLADRLKKDGVKPGTGTIDISFHRDDIGANPIPKEHSPTFIPHDVNGATVILADDVLHSGRTVKAALDELFDHGRPASVELAVLVDRGGRLLPVAATYGGITLIAYDDEKVKVRLDADEPARDTLVTEPATKPKSPRSKPIA
jgi:pyrimidine operon attenuation protein/uracil phosphoribosyltransferase